MLNLFFRWFGEIYYIRFDGKRIRVSTPEDGMIFDEEPLIAVAFPAKGHPKAIAVGKDAKSAVAPAGARLEVLNAFNHSRIGIGDFTLAEQTLKQIFRRINASAWFKPPPTIIMHPLYRYDDEFTQIELRVFRELALGTGASKVMLCTGRELSQDELRGFREPPA